MEFGKVNSNEIARINYKLPPDSSFTNNMLRSAGRSDHPLVYVGCAKWGRKDWIGSLYPEGTKEKDFLDLYVRQFNSIELNATFYKIYDTKTIGKWAEKAKGKDFLFCPKMSKPITQYTDLASPGTTVNTNNFLDGIRAFGEHLGTVFVQMNEKFAPEGRARLYKFLSSLPKDIHFFLELRHEQWFADKEIKNDWVQTLAGLGIGVLITDASGRRDVVHAELTVPKAFIRFVGNGLHPTDYKRIDEWVSRIQSWLDKGLQELYFFMHQHDEKNSPVLCDYVIEQLNKKCGTNLKRVEFMKGQGKLF